MAVVLVDQFPGADASERAKNALTSRLSGGLLVGPTVLDFRGLDGVQDWTLDPTSVLSFTDRTAVIWVWGPNTYRMTKAITIPPNGPYGAAATGASIRVLPHHHHVFQGTTFIMQNSSGTRVLATHLFLSYLDNTLATANATNGSSVVTVTSANGIEIGTPISLPGHLPRTGSDTTAVASDPGIGGTSINVASTAQFPPDNSNNAATILVGSEIIRYTSKDATHFLGCTRGAYGTTAASHAVSSLVSRVVADTYYVKSVSGTQLTLDHALGVTATALPVYQGTQDVSFLGSAVFDGNLDASNDDPGNPSAVFTMGSRLIRVAPNIIIRNWDHGGFFSYGGQDHAIMADRITRSAERISIMAALLFLSVHTCGYLAVANAVRLMRT